MPSAARPFSVRVLEDLRQRDILIAPLELGAGVSSLEVEDSSRAVTAYPEPFFVPATSAAAINDARGEGRLVIAVGTTVVRALESAWDGQRVRAARGFTRTLIGGARGNDVVDALITGFHHARATHLSVLNAIAGVELVKSAYDEARRGDYLWHEFGDSHLILGTASAAKGRRSEPRNDQQRSGE
jgi:S-adenosylmethionine:tRNA ribosyltransferase-isomerase